MVKKILFILAAICIASSDAAAQKQVAFAKQRLVDSLIGWLNSHRVDSLWVLNAHRVSYRLSETETKKSFLYYEKVSSVSDSMNFLYGKALAQINLALLLYNSGNFDASNQAFFKAIEYAEKGNYPRLVAIALNNIGDNFKTLKDYDKCREYTRRAIELNRSSNTPGWQRGVAVNYELLQQCDFEQQKYDDAWNNLEAGIPYAAQANDSYIMSQYYLGFGKLYAVHNQVDSAAHYFDKALEQARLEGDLRNQHAVYLSRATSLPRESKEQCMADLYAALSIAKETDYLKGVADAAEALSDVYDKQENKDSSLFYFRVYRTASNSLFSENNKRNVIIKESEWRLRKKDAENNQLKSKASLQEKEIVTKNSLLIGGAVTLVLAIALGILAFRSIRSKKRQVELEKKKGEAELRSRITDMEFKAFKAQLNPHFIFNYLNSISGYILLSQPQKASDMIKRFSKMLRNVLQNSEQNEVALSEDIKTITQYVELMHEIAAPPFTYTIQASDDLRQLQKTVPPLFIQPYVENAIVHGLKQAEGEHLFLTIAYHKYETALLVTITDNGIGFHRQQVRTHLMQDDRVHLGLSVTEKRIQVFAEKNQYEAEIHFLTAHPGTSEPGTIVQVKIEGFFA